MLRTLNLTLAATLVAIMPQAIVAQDRPTLTILSHAVHQSAARGTGVSPGGDVAGEWADTNGVELNWITLNVSGVHDRLFRELALRETEIDLVAVLQSRLVPSVADRLLPLTAFIENAPIDDISGIPAGMMQAVTFDGALVAIPYRHATNGLLINTALLEESGLERPGTIADLLAVARAATTVREDGTRVHGLIMTADSAQTVLQFAAGFGARYITSDFEVVAESPEMIAAFTELNALFEEGVLPPNVTSLNLDELVAAMREGRGVMAINAFSRYTALNDPEASLYPGEIDAFAFPTSVEGEFAAITEFWSWAIPANAVEQDLAYDLMRTLMSEEGTIRAALNGNGPVRPAAYESPQVQETLPYAASEAQALEFAVIAIPPFDGAVEAQAIFIEEMQSALLGLKTPEQAVADLQSRAEALVADR